jgi:serine/threonine-protein kinase
MLGSPCFMSPEQVRSAKTVDPRSDLWSAGVSLYYLVTGALPFKGETYGEVFASVLAPEPARLPSSENPALPPEFDALVARCLARDREQRFADAAALAEALAPFAPEPDRAAVDRIRRILAAAPNTPRFTQSQPILAINLTNAPARATPPPPAPTFSAPASALDSPDTLIPGATPTEDEETTGAAASPADTDTFIPELAEPAHPTEPATPPPATLKREAVRPAPAPEPEPEPEDSSATVPGMPAFSMDDVEDEVTVPHASVERPKARRPRGLLMLLVAIALCAASVTGYLAFRAIASPPTPPSQGP